MLPTPFELVKLGGQDRLGNCQCLVDNTLKASHDSTFEMSWFERERLRKRERLSSRMNGSDQPEAATCQIISNQIKFPHILHATPGF